MVRRQVTCALQIAGQGNALEKAAGVRQPLSQGASLGLKNPELLKLGLCMTQRVSVFADEGRGRCCQFGGV
jgi:hypothetical protein